MTQTTTTTLANSIETFAHSNAVGAALRVPLFYNYLCHFKDLSSDPTKVWRTTSRPDITDAAAVVEGADVVDVAQTDAKVDITVDTIARSMLVSYEAEWSTWINELANAGSQVAMACKRKIESLIITDTTPNLTDEQGDASTAMTFEQLVAFRMLFEAKYHRNPPVGSVVNLVMHPGPFGVLVNDMVTSTNNMFASTFGAAQTAQVIQAGNTGAVYMIGGVRVFVTSRVPVGDTTGKGNFFCLSGGEIGSCLGLAVKRGTTPELRPTEKKLARRSLAYASVGTGIIRDDYGMLAVSAAA